MSISSIRGGEKMERAIRLQARTTTSRESANSNRSLLGRQTQTLAPRSRLTFRGEGNS